MTGPITMFVFLMSLWPSWVMWGRLDWRIGAAMVDPTTAGGAVLEQLADPAKAAPALGLLLLIGFLLTLVFLLGTFVIVRSLRRYWAAAARRRCKQTPMDDVWAMHKPPPDVDFDEQDACDSDH